MYDDEHDDEPDERLIVLEEIGAGLLGALVVAIALAWWLVRRWEGAA